MKASSAIQKAVLIILSVLLSLFIAEMGLRLLHPNDSRYYVWQPDLKHIFFPDSSIFYGIHGNKTFSINHQGLRGDLLLNNIAKPNSKPQRILRNRMFLGGSTTECLYLDDSETWWHLWDSLSSNAKIKVAGGSIGKSGVTSFDHYLQMKYFVPQLKYTDEVIIMLGLNDLMKQLSNGPPYKNNLPLTPAIEDSLVRIAFLHKGRNYEKNMLKRTALFELVQAGYHRLKPGGVKWMIQDDNGESLKRWRHNRQQASVLIDTLPDMTSALADYLRNLELIYRQAQKQKLPLIFINQAALYKDTMSAYEKNLLWMGGVGEYQQEPGHAYYSAKALRTGVEMYNAALKGFCQVHQLTLIDIDSALPRDTSVFYDDCHFNEQGARKFAAYLSTFLSR